jgi:hypothetical protein
MNWKNLLSLLLVLLPLSVNAGDVGPKARPFTFAVEGGPLLSLLIGSGAPTGIELTGGYCVGVEVSRVPKHAGFQTGLFYAHEGVDTEGGYSLALDYLIVPVMLRLNLTAPSAKIKPHFLLGPQFGCLLNAKEKWDGANQDAEDRFKTLEVGIRGGAGLDLGPLTLQANFSTSVSNILKNSNSFCGNLTLGTLIGARF